MADWRTVCSETAIGDGSYQLLETDEVVVAVFRLGRELYAIEDVCTHDGEELTGGPLDGDEIICPRHGARFCIRTGEVKAPPAYEPLHCYDVRIEAGQVQVDLASAHLS